MTKLEHEGVRSFCDSHHELLDCIQGKLGVPAPVGAERCTERPQVVSETKPPTIAP